MSRIKYNENELLENPTNFYKEFNKFSERIYHCGNDKLQIECNISNMSNELIEYIKKLHLTDYNKSLELIDVNNKLVNFYAFKSIHECQNCKQKDARIAELEKQLADKKETATYKNNFCINCCKDKSGEQIICLKCHEEVCNAYKKQLAELEELKQNAIVPKFYFGDTIFAVVTYIDDPKDKTVIESGIVQKIGCDKNQIKYWCDNGRIYWEDECEKLFATEQEAQQKLKELEENKND